MFIFLFFLSTYINCYMDIRDICTGTLGNGDLSRHTSELYVSEVNAQMKWETKVDHLGNWQYLRTEKMKEYPKYGVLGTQCVFGQGDKKQLVTVCPAHPTVALVTFMAWANTNLNRLLSEKWDTVLPQKVLCGIHSSRSSMKQCLPTPPRVDSSWQKWMW